MKKIYTEEQKQQVKELYLQGKAYREIAEIAGIKGGSLPGLIAELGVPKRRGGKKEGQKVCSHCRRTIPSESVFCMYCGNDVRSEELILLQKMERVMESICLLPEAARDTCSKNIIEVMAYLRGKAK